jgi:hypothetical protein
LPYTICLHCQVLVDTHVKRLTHIIFLGFDRGYCFPDSIFFEKVHNARYLSNLGHVNDAVVTRMDHRVLTSGMALSRWVD